MRILVFGDSIAAGAFDTESNGWVSLLAMYQYQRILDSKWTEGDSVVNVSVSGDTTADLLQRIDSDLASRKWQEESFAAILAIGTNDAAKVSGNNQVVFEEFTRNVVSLVSTLQEKSSRVIMLGLPPVYEKLSSPWCFDTTADWQNAELTRYDAELKRIAAEEGVLFVPLQDILDRYSGQHLPEGLHPNAEGHRLIFERVKGVLEKAGIL